MPQNVADLQKQMTRGREKADIRQSNEDYFKVIDEIIELKRRNQELPKPRPNKEFINGKGANDVMPFTGQLNRDARIENTGEEAARQVNASRSAARNASGRTPIRKPTTTAKPVSAAAGAKMVGAMSGKSNGTFAGGSPRSSMSKNLKIK